MTAEQKMEFVVKTGIVVFGSFCIAHGSLALAQAMGSATAVAFGALGIAGLLVTFVRGTGRG